MTVSTRRMVTVGLLLALLLAGIVSFYASGSPDGLNRVALDLGFAESERSSPTTGGPLAGYETDGLGDARWSRGLAGVVGCLAVLGLSTILVRLRSSSPRRRETPGA